MPSITCKDAAEAILERVDGERPDTDEQRHELETEAIGDYVNLSSEEEIESLSEDSRKHYRVGMDLGLLPKYHWPDPPEAFLQSLRGAIACHGIAEALAYLRRNR